MMEAAGIAGMDNPPKMPGNYLLCFRNKPLAEKLRGFTGIAAQWASTEVHTEALLEDVIGQFPFLAFVHEYQDDGFARESGFRWKVST